MNYNKIKDILFYLFTIRLTMTMIKIKIKKSKEIDILKLLKDYN